MHITTTEPSSDRTGAGATIIARANASVSEQFSSQACVKAKQQTPLPTRIPERKTALGALWAVAVFAVRYLDRVMHNALRLLKVPIAFLCFLCFLALSIHSLKPLLYSAFGPVCSVPVVSKFAFYHYLVPPDGTSQEEDILRLFNASYAHFERVIEGTASGSALAHRLDFAHMAMSDVEALVRNSDLASRDVIADAIQDTKDAAGTIAQELSDLDAKATFVTDRLIALNKHTLMKLTGAGTQTLLESLIARIFIPSQTAGHIQETVTKEYIEELDTLDSEMKVMINDAKFCIRRLERLGASLVKSGTLAQKEYRSIAADQADVLAALWTRLGGNKRTLYKQAVHMELLTNVGEYRKDATRHVTIAYSSLRAWKNDAATLGKKLSGADERIPVERLMITIDQSLERLTHAKYRVMAIVDEAYGKKRSVEKSY